MEEVKKRFHKFKGIAWTPCLETIMLRSSGGHCLSESDIELI